MKHIAYIAALLIVCGCCKSPSPPETQPLSEPAKVFSESHTRFDLPYLSLLDEAPLRFEIKWHPDPDLSVITSRPIHIYRGIIHDTSVDWMERDPQDTSQMYLIDDRNMN